MAEYRTEFVDRVHKQAELLAQMAKASEDGAHNLLSQSEVVPLAHASMDMTLVHRAVLARDIVLLAAAIRLLGVAALRLTAAPYDLEVWELIASHGSEDMIELCQCALEQCTVLDTVENRWGEHFEYLIRTFRPALGSHLFGQYWTTKGSGERLVCAPHNSQVDAQQGTWVRTEQMSFAPENWLRWRCAQASSIDQCDPREIEVRRHLAHFMRELVKESSHPEGWYTRALIVDRCVDRVQNCPDIGQGVFAGQALPRGCLLGLASGYLASQITAPEEADYCFMVPAGMVSPKRVGGLISRCQASFPNMMELHVRLPVGVLVQAYLAMEDIPEGDQLTHDYAFQAPVKFGPFVELRPEARNNFISWMGAQTPEAIIEEMQHVQGVCFESIQGLNADQWLSPEDLDVRRQLSQMIYVMGTPTALLQLFCAAPNLAATLEPLFNKLFNAHPAFNLFGGPDSLLVQWANQLSADQRAALAAQADQIAADFSGGTLCGLIADLGRPGNRHAAELREHLATWLAAPTAKRPVSIQAELVVLEQQRSKVLKAQASS